MRLRTSLVTALVLAAALGAEGVLLAQETIKPLNRRIVGGERTDIKQHPWQVALQVQGNFSCGGSIIAETWVLTAAHCFLNSKQANDWRVKAGATNYASGGPWEQIERIVIHPKYNASNYEHDIALVKLKSKTNGRVIARAPASMTVPVGQPLEVTGWGVTAEGGAGSRVLQRAIIPHADIVACNAPSSYDGKIMPGMMCAGQKEGGVDACQGDSGGPLVWRSQDGPILVGLVSWGEGCANNYGVYTRVGAYTDWIDKELAADRK